MGMASVLQVFDHEPKFWTHRNFDLMMALDEESGSPELLQFILKTKFHENPSSGWNVSLKAANVILMVALKWKLRESVSRIHLLENINVWTKFNGILVWTEVEDWLASTAVPRAMAKYVS